MSGPMGVIGGGGPVSLGGIPAVRPQAAGEEVDFGGRDFSGGVDIGSVDLGGGVGPGVGGEVELDDGPVNLPQGVAVPRRERRTIESEAPPPVARGRAVKVLAVLFALFAVGGLSLTAVPSVGPFGAYYIKDRMSAETYASGLDELRKASVEDLDQDTLGSANTAVDRAKVARAERERHQETSAYAAYVIYARSVRFGRDGGLESTAKSLLDSTDRSAGTPSIKLAVAAEDVLGGQLARARQTVQELAAARPDDVDVAVLAGEIELVAKEPGAAIEAFTKASDAHKSARTLFGLARAQLASGKTAEAEATAKSVLELSKTHVAARTLLASIAAATQAREAEALTLLQQVTTDESVKSVASASELVDAYVQLGRVQLLASRVSQAQEAFGEALKLNPQAVPALVGSGELFYRSGRFSEAEARYESASRADADSADAKIGLAKTYLSLERQKEAKDLLTKLQTGRPDDARVYYWLARIEEALGNRKEPEALYGEAIKRAKTAEEGVPSYVALALLLSSSMRPDEAAKKLAEAAEKWPGSYELARARGDVALKSGHYDEALSQYELALKVNKEDLATRFQLGVTLRRMRKFDEANAVFDAVEKVDKDYPELTLERGLYYEETGQRDQALAMYAEALQKAPNDVDLKLRVGGTQVAAGLARQAEPILKEVIRERANSAEANHFLGRAQLLSGSNLNEAMRHLKRAVEIDPNRAEYHFYYGWAANESGQPTVAEAALKEALKLDSSLGMAYWQRAVLYQKQGKVADAIKDALTALEKRPSLFEAHATLAHCYDEQNNLTKAEESWRSAIKGNDKNSDWHYKLGRLLVRRNQEKDSVAELEKAIELAQTRDPRPTWLPTAHSMLADSYKVTQKDKAIEHLTEYLRLAPHDDVYRPDAERLLAELKPN